MDSEDKAPVAQKKAQNKLRNVITSDGNQYKVMDCLLIRFSGLIRSILEDEGEEEDIKLLEADSESLQVMIKFMNLHEKEPPCKLNYPLKYNKNLKEVMEEADAQLVTSLLEKPDSFALFKKVLEASGYLQMDEFRVRLMAGLTIKMLRRDLSQLTAELKTHEYN